MARFRLNISASVNNTSHVVFQTRFNVWEDVQAHVEAANVFGFNCVVAHDLNCCVVKTKDDFDRWLLTVKK